MIRGSQTIISYRISTQLLSAFIQGSSSIGCVFQLDVPCATPQFGGNSLRCVPAQHGWLSCFSASKVWPLSTFIKRADAKYHEQLRHLASSTGRRGSRSKREDSGSLSPDDNGHLGEAEAGGSIDDAKEDAKRYARLVSKRPSDIEAKIAELCTALGCTPERAAALLKQHVSLITLPAGTLTSRIDSFTSILGCPKQELQRSAARSGSVLAITPDKFQARVDHLKSVLGHQQAVQAVLHGTMDLIKCDPSVLQQKLGFLCTLGLTEAEAATVLLKEARVATASLSTLTERVEVLEKLLQGTPWALKDLVVACPAILRRANEALGTKLGILQQAASSHPAWQSAWNGFSASTLGNFLGYSMERFERLQEVVQLGAQQQYSIATLLKFNDQRWQQVMLQMRSDAGVGSGVKEKS